MVMRHDYKVKLRRNQVNWRVAVIVSIIIICGGTVGAQWSTEEPVQQSAFREGRWITGLAGSINSGVTRFDDMERGSTNGYFMELSAAHFFAERWSVGAVFQAGRTSDRRFVETDSESLFFGPSVAYYFMKSRSGSIYLTLATGYIRFREETILEQLNLSVKESLEGQGLGILNGLAYAFVVDDDIVFDIGLVFSSSWLYGDRISQPNGVVTKEQFYTSDVRFVFGFRVIL